MASPLCTERLELIPATREILEADLKNWHQLARLLHAAIPYAWPPPLMDEDVIREFIRMCSDTGGGLLHVVLGTQRAGRRRPGAHRQRRNHRGRE